jgi:UDP:flavonoid glycosyltransferase YjiC (YdhE family)
MVVLPLFWDQYDNAQRIQETGFGLRLDTYAHEPAELLAAIENLLANGELRRRLNATSERLQQRPGTARAAGLIEQLETRH